MQVHQILKSKADDGVVTLTPDTTLARASEMLGSRRIGAVVVSSDGKRALGILSERDIVREVGRRGGGCLGDRIDTVMTRDIVSCRRDDSAEDVMRKMTEGRFRHVPVIEAGEMVGLISIGDVVKARLSELAMEKDALEGMIKGF